MKALSLRAQLGWVAAAYAAVLAVSTFLVVERYLQYVRHPEDANQYSGMWAGGDMIVGVFIFCLFLVPTLFLVLVMRNSEPLYTSYNEGSVGYQSDRAGFNRAIRNSGGERVRFASGFRLHV